MVVLSSPFRGASSERGIRLCRVTACTVPATSGVLSLGNGGHEDGGLDLELLGIGQLG